MDDYLKNLGKRIRALRLSKNLTIEQLSEMVGKSDNFIGNIERGEGAPAIQTLIDIANSLEVGTDTLLQDYLYVYQNMCDDDFHDKLKRKIHTLSADEQKVVFSMLELLINFKNI